MKKDSVYLYCLTFTFEKKLESFKYNKNLFIWNFIHTQSIVIIIMERSQVIESMSQNDDSNVYW